jgi:hypothetical protein
VTRVATWFIGPDTIERMDGRARNDSDNTPVYADYEIKGKGHSIYGDS